MSKKNKKKVNIVLSLTPEEFAYFHYGFHIDTQYRLISCMDKESIENLDEEFIMAAIGENFHSIRYIQTPTKEVIMALARKFCLDRVPSTSTTLYQSDVDYISSLDGFSKENKELFFKYVDCINLIG